MSDFDERMDLMADAFCVGPQPLERWRPYVQIDQEGRLKPKGWTPESENASLIEQRNYQARCAYEYAQLVEIARDLNYHIVDGLRVMHVFCVLDMRFHEIALANFQILTQTVGVDNRGTSKDDLYLAAMTLHCTVLYLHDVVAKAHMAKHGRKDLMAERPYSTDSRSALARSICTSIRAMHLAYLPAFAELRDNYNKAEETADKELHQLMKRMQLVMQQLDKVLVVLVTPTGEPSSQTVREV